MRVTMSSNISVLAEMLQSTLLVLTWLTLCSKIDRKSVTKIPPIKTETCVLSEHLNTVLTKQITDDDDSTTQSILFTHTLDQLESSDSTPLAKAQKSHCCHVSLHIHNHQSKLINLPTINHK